MFSNSLKLLLLGFMVVSVQTKELPITTTEVFVQSGEVSSSSGNVMARCNDETSTRMTISFECEGNACPESKEVAISDATDFTNTFEVTGLDSFTLYSYTVTCSDSTIPGTGSFKTAPADDEEVAIKFVWCADLAGQGYGRNPDFELVVADGSTVKGGYIVFDTMEKLSPDFALFQGDMIYADNSIAPSKDYTNGTETLGTWINNPSKDFIAVTLDEFRANWKYNFGDEKMQSFLSKVPVFVQWDDHEVTNNWWPGEIMNGSPLYEDGLEANLLYANSLQAFYEYNPIADGESIYRSQRFGKHLEVFFPDYRSFRDPNPDNTNDKIAAMMGPEQTEWLKKALVESDATWKVISSHDPFGIVTGGSGDYDAFGNEDARILGREFELVDLFGFIESEGITGVVSVTSDVHFTAHVNMHPDRAMGNFTAFKPLDEFVIGPIHAGSFGPNYMDTSFGAEYLYEMGPLTLGYERWANLAPEVNELQSFGCAEVSEDGSELTIQLININGSVMFEKVLTAEGGIFFR